MSKPMIPLLPDRLARALVACVGALALAACAPAYTMVQPAGAGAGAYYTTSGPYASPGDYYGQAGAESVSYDDGYDDEDAYGDVDGYGSTFSVTLGFGNGFGWPGYYGGWPAYGYGYGYPWAWGGYGWRSHGHHHHGHDRRSYAGDTADARSARRWNTGMMPPPRADWRYGGTPRVSRQTYVRAPAMRPNRGNAPPQQRSWSEAMPRRDMQGTPRPAWNDSRPMSRPAGRAWSGSSRAAPERVSPPPSHGARSTKVH